MSTTTDLNVLKINYLSQAQYDEALENDEIDDNELYLTPALALVNGSATGSIRGIWTATESNSYTMGENAMALGEASSASGDNSISEGGQTTASGNCSHAEGEQTIASGNCSHAEGEQTFASGYASHAEGEETIASGSNTHSQNYGTIAQRRSQTALGEYNIADTTGTTSTKGEYIVIIGNGTADNARSNALTIDWLGGVELYVDVDSSADASTDAVSGTDMDLFNTIRALGWYNDVMS